VALHKLEALDPAGLAYLNRLSDALFVVARWLSVETGSPEIPWNPPK